MTGNGDPRLTRGEAELTARQVNRYWKARGYDPQASVVEVKITEDEARRIGLHPMRRNIYKVISNCINGVPQRRCVPIRL